ncbi:hypothetical protein AX15_001956 [Amanita polypyramis BW_CC]|nr:hypothetical protein AX15_001956 [Amanita polypyramis BW_CC]
MLVNLSTGVSLEINLLRPSGQQNVGRNKLAVLLHPWSWLGGQMHDPVLALLVEPLREKGFHTLRFNSRGVGSSTGWASLTGTNEGRDLEALVQWALGQIADIESLVLLGYSHGALIASLHPVLSNVKTTHVLLSYPLSPRGWITMLSGDRYQKKLEALVHDENSNVVVIYGDQDEFTAVSKNSILSQPPVPSSTLSLLFLLSQMPLPDERPRQSVANLIGRFENQTKRQAPSNGHNPRSSSVASHNTGDSLNNEQKEKREWPPKSVSERITSLEGSPVRPRPSISASHSAPQPNMPQMSVEPRMLLSGVSESIPTDDQKQVVQTEAKVENHIDADNAPAPDAKPVTPSGLPRSVQPAVKSTTAKGPSSVTSKSLPRTINKPQAPASKQPPGAPAIQPLKPQHTGLSMVSTTSAKKPTIVSTPIKIPVRSTAATAAPTRPKTPSSGLFAPTAASLAKSRSAQAASTSPVKKITLTSSASDRLSKPTAASLSKARSPVPPISQLTRPNVKPIATAPTPTKSTVKLKGATPAKKPSSVKKAMATSSDRTADVSIHELSESNGQRPINGHTLEEHTEDAPLSEGPVEQNAEPVVQELSGGRVTLDESTDNADKAPVDVHPEQANANITVDTTNDETTPGPSSEAQPHIPSDNDVDEHPSSEPGPEESKVLQGDDIENLLNLLESASIPKVRPTSIASIPDEVHEIPDEE